MVDDFDDGNFVEAWDTLVGFIVVDENHANRRRLGKGAFEDCAHESA